MKLTKKLNAKQTRTVITGRIRSVLSENRQVRAIINTEVQARDNNIVESSGLSLDAYRKNPIVLLNHRDDCPVARASWVSLVGTEIHSLIQFPPAGVSEDSDRTLGLIQSGVINATSIGFMPIDMRPITGGGFRIIRSELYEFSFCSIPSNTQAAIIERSYRDSEKPADWATPEGRITHAAERRRRWKAQGRRIAAAPAPATAAEIAGRRQDARRRKIAAARWLAP